MDLLLLGSAGCLLVVFDNPWLERAPRRRKKSRRRRRDRKAGSAREDCAKQNKFEEVKRRRREKGMATETRQAKGTGYYDCNYRFANCGSERARDCDAKTASLGQPTKKRESMMLCLEQQSSVGGEPTSHSTYTVRTAPQPRKIPASLSSRRRLHKG